MTESKKIINVLCVGESEEIFAWVKQSFKDSAVPARIRCTDPLRITSPESSLSDQDLIIVEWGRTNLVSADEIINRKAAHLRSREGTVFELERQLGNENFGRIMTIGPEIRREDTIFLAEAGCKYVMSLPDKRNLWAAESQPFCRRALHLIDQEKTRASSQEVVAVQRFNKFLGRWELLGDDVKMEAHDALLKALGTSAKYFELMAKKCLKEKNTKGAEQWLGRAIEKNPSYLNPLQILADIYMRTNRINDALALLEKLRLSNPRHVDRLVKIGKCHMAVGSLDKAEKVFSEALQVDEFHGQVREELGKVKILKGDYESAKNLLSMNTNSQKMAGFLNQLGIKLVEQRKYKESILLYKQAQYVLPGNEVSHLLFFNIGLAFAKWGKVNNARKFLHLALIRDPSYERATQLMKSLDNRANAA